MTVITLGGVAYNVHGTEAGMKAFVGGRLSTDAWDDASSTDRKKAQIMAASLFDALENNPTSKWTGTRTVSSQPLPWPRDNATCNGEAVTSGSTPSGILLGEYELTLLLLEDPDVFAELTQGSIVKSVIAKGVGVTFVGPSRGTADDLTLPAGVHRHVGCYLEGGLSAITPTIDPSLVGSQFRETPSMGSGFA